MDTEPKYKGSNQTFKDNAIEYLNHNSPPVNQAFDKKLNRQYNQFYSHIKENIELLKKEYSSDPEIINKLNNLDNEEVIKVQFANYIAIHYGSYLNEEEDDE